MFRTVYRTQARNWAKREDRRVKSSIRLMDPLVGAPAVRIEVIVPSVVYQGAFHSAASD